MKRSLTNEEIKKIRIMFTKGYKKRTLAKIYRCSPTTIATWIPVDATRRSKIFHLKRKHKFRCSVCNILYSKHKRCKICSILIHPEPFISYCTCNEKNNKIK